MTDQPPGTPPGWTPPPPPPPAGYQQYQPYAGQPGWSPTGAPVDVLGRPLAEWWKRVVAYLIDGFAVGIPSIIVIFVLFAGAFSQVETDPVTGEISSGGGALVGAYVLGYGMYFAIAIAYFGLMNGSARGQTLGKMALKIQTRSANDGGAVGIGRGLLRYFITIVLSLFTCGIGSLLDLLWPLWDPKRQTLHDKVASTVVIDAP